MAVGCEGVSESDHVAVVAEYGSMSVVLWVGLYASLCL